MKYLNLWVRNLCPQKIFLIQKEREGKCSPVIKKLLSPKYNEIVKNQMNNKKHINKIIIKKTEKDYYNIDRNI